MKKFLKILQQILSGKFLTTTVARRYYPFLLFVAALALVWIAITYSGIQTRREIGEMEGKLEIAKIELKQQQTNYTKNSRPSQLLGQLKNSQDTTNRIKMAHDGTYKIIVKNEGGKNE